MINDSIADESRARGERLAALGVPPLCPFCQTTVDSVTRVSGRFVEDGPFMPPRTTLHPCGHVLESAIGQLTAPPPGGHPVPEETA